MNSEDRLIADREYLRMWRKKNPAKVKGHLKKQTETGYFAKYALDWRQKNKLKWRARWTVRNRVVAGTLIRPSVCEDCAKEAKTQAHHHNGYENPLDVKWLCHSCHLARHGKTPSLGPSN